MNEQLISLSDESLDQVAGGALITLDVTGTVRGIAGGIAQIGEAAFGLGGALAKFGKQTLHAVGDVVGSVVTIK